jgi:Cu-processing system permease protein
MSSFFRMAAIAGNTYREVLRNRAFIGLLVVAAAFLIFSMALSELARPGEEPRVVMDFGYFAISLFGVVIAIVMGVILLHQEVEKKTIYTIIPKSVHRYEVVLGKYLGMLVILLAELVVMSLIWFLVLWVSDAPISVDTVMAMGLIFLEMMIIASMALLFSAFSSPILSGIFTFGFFLMGRLSYVVSDMLLATKRGFFVDYPVFRPVGQFFAGSFPDLRAFNVSQDLLLGTPIGVDYLLVSGAYAMSYVVFFLAVAVLFFQRRDFV